MEARFYFRFFSGTLLSRVTGLGREICMAAFFGALPVVAAFWMAFRYTFLLRRILGEGALNCALIPHIEKLNHQSPAKAGRFFWDLLIRVAILLAGGLGVLALGFVLGPILGIWELSLISQFTLCLLPATFFMCLYALNGAYLNCMGSFFRPSFAPLLVNICWILGVIFLKDRLPEKALQILCIWIVVGFFLQWALTFPAVFRDLKKRGTFEQPPTELSEILGVVTPFLLALVGVTATQINSAVDTLFARFSDLSGPAYLWYAIRLQQLPLALFGVGIASTLFPSLSQAAQLKNPRRFSDLIDQGIKRIITWMLPATFCTLCCALPAVSVVFGWGAFTALAIEQTAFALIAYAFALAPMTFVMLLAAAHYAKGRYQDPAIASIASVGVNCLLNAIFVFGFGLGAYSVALATTLSSLFNLILLARSMSAFYSFQWKKLAVHASKVGAAIFVGVVFSLFLGAQHSSRFIQLLGAGGGFLGGALSIALLVKTVENFAFLPRHSSQD